jgi:hypothetical protein
MALDGEISHMASSSDLGKDNERDENGKWWKTIKLFKLKEEYTKKAKIALNLYF